MIEICTLKKGKEVTISKKYHINLQCIKGIVHIAAKLLLHGYISLPYLLFLFFLFFTVLIIVLSSSQINKNILFVIVMMAWYHDSFVMNRSLHFTDII